MTPALEGEAPPAGFSPYAPDLAAIQEAMRAALAAVPPQALRGAWRQGGVQWGWDFLKTWVRGLRRADLEMHAGRLDVRFTAAGPGGTYEYAFTVRLGDRARGATGHAAYDCGPA